MHRLAPNAKVIFLLRDPVARAYSHYRHYVKIDLKAGTRAVKRAQASKIKVVSCRPSPLLDRCNGYAVPPPCRQSGR